MLKISFDYLMNLRFDNLFRQQKCTEQSSSSYLITKLFINVTVRVNSVHIIKTYQDMYENFI